MNLDFLQENLRLEILRRIRRGLITGAELARASGFRHAHISNFLHGKRSLSLQGFDRILAAGNLSILDLIPAPNAAPSTPGGVHSPVQSIPIVSQQSIHRRVGGDGKFRRERGRACRIWFDECGQLQSRVRSGQLMPDAQVVFAEGSAAENGNPDWTGVGHSGCYLPATVRRQRA